MNTVEGKPEHGLTSVEGTREKRRIGPGQRTKERTLFQSGESCLLGFGRNTCRENARARIWGDLGCREGSYCPLYGDLNNAEVTR